MFSLKLSWDFHDQRAPMVSLNEYCVPLWCHIVPTPAAEPQPQPTQIVSCVFTWEVSTRQDGLSEHRESSWRTKRKLGEDLRLLSTFQLKMSASSRWSGKRIKEIQKTGFLGQSCRRCGRHLAFLIVMEMAQSQWRWTGWSFALSPHFFLLFLLFFSFFPCFSFSLFPLFFFFVL